MAMGRLEKATHSSSDNPTDTATRKQAEDAFRSVEKGKLEALKLPATPAAKEVKTVNFGEKGE